MMSIQAGEKMPSGQFGVMTGDGPGSISTDELYAGKKVVLFAVPGAFTPTCSAKHLPGFVDHADEIRAKGVDEIACVAVNDAFVMGAWGKDQNVGDKVKMVGDGDAALAKATGLELDLNGNGFGMRCQRFSMVVNDGVVESLNLESDGGYEVTSAEHMLANL